MQCFQTLDRERSAAMKCTGCQQDLSKGLIDVRLLLWRFRLYMECPLCRIRQRVKIIDGEKVEIIHE
jgi:Zn finger protein HypA/HybF involved in hydrogenase expression